MTRFNRKPPSCPPRPTPRHQKMFGQGLSIFWRDETGTLTIFGLYAFLMILMVGGIGIDLMRYERERTKLQATLDNAVLAAADLDQELDPAAVVKDYFAKAGMSDHLVGEPHVENGEGYRIVSANARYDVPTQFMHMLGVDDLTAPAAGTAEESVGGIEISLVLDVSGSMGRNSRLTNLKSAARDFVDTMIDTSEDGKMSISIVPYSAQVAVPPEFLNAVGVDRIHNYSNCVHFEGQDFNTTEIKTDGTLKQTMHFDPWNSSYDARVNSPPGLVRSPICHHAESRESMVLSKDRDALKSFIQNLYASGNTSIDVGMKWGTAMLDPSLQPVINELSKPDPDTNEPGFINASFSSRPETYDSKESLKVVVLMTDGQNTNQYYMYDRYRSGNSNLWWNAEAKEYSIYDPYYNDYYRVKTGRYLDHAYGNKPGEIGEAEALAHVDLFARTTLNGSGPIWDYGMPYGTYTSVAGYTKDTRTRAICDAAKRENILIYSIGFEAPSSGENILKYCASSPSHYFDVYGLEIKDAFSAIAASIRQLRLTQ